MAEKHIKRPRDPVQLAKLIGDIATGQVKDSVEDGKSVKEAKPLQLSEQGSSGAPKS